LDKELVDEMIYSTTSPMDRLILELPARCGLRIGEVLKLKGVDVMDRKLLIREPKSGKENETAFMPEQIAKRLAEYITVTMLVLTTVCSLFAIQLCDRLLRDSVKGITLRSLLMIFDDTRQPMPVGMASLWRSYPKYC